MAIDRVANLYLRLKSGVTLTRAGQRFYLGLPTRGLMLEDGLQIQLARALDGAHRVNELAASLHCSINEIDAFAELLLSADLLDLAEINPKQATLDLSARVIEVRRGIERAPLAHRSGVHDGGISELRAREEATILISGENRLGRHLLTALQASGFTHTRLISRVGVTPRIEGEDFCGIVVRAGDIGKLRGEFNEELIRSAQIARGQTVAKSFPDLIISTVPLEWDYVQRWMSEGSAHLHIHQIVGREIEVGPLVLPGLTPCLRCVALTKRGCLCRR